MAPLEGYTFISYAQEDEDSAERLCRDLESNNAGCWLYKRDRKLGRELNEMFKSAMAKASSCVVLISRARNEKEGYVHVEETMALERQNKRPHAKPFIIPARLEECEYPPRLKHIDTVDLFPHWETGLRLILKAVGQEGQQTRQDLEKILGNPHDRTLETKYTVVKCLYGSQAMPYARLQHSCLGQPVGDTTRTPGFFNDLYSLESSGIVNINTDDSGGMSVALTPLARGVILQSVCLNTGSAGLDSE